MRESPWRRSWRRPRRLAIPWHGSSSRRSAPTASDGPLYFDTSALVKHCHTEIGTSKVRALMSEPGAEHLISRLATVEMLSGFAGKVRSGVFPRSDFHQLRGLFLTDV